jgi:hypothetical protein
MRMALIRGRGDSALIRWATSPNCTLLLGRDQYAEIHGSIGRYLDPLAAAGDNRERGPEFRQVSLRSCNRAKGLNSWAFRPTRHI